MPEPSRRTHLTPTGSQVAGGVLAGQAAAVRRAGKSMLKDAPRVTRFVASRIPGLPGLVFDAANYHRAEDKGRAAAELIGQGLGGAVGSAGGPLGVAVGATVGAVAGEYLYDHKDDIEDWMDARWDELARRAGEQVLP